LSRRYGLSQSRARMSLVGGAELVSSVSMKDVAARAGVSLGTVSNVLNAPERVVQHTQERVRQAISDLGYVRNEAARQLRAGRSRTLGLVVLDVGNPFFTDIAAGVEARAAEDGFYLLLCNSGESAERERHYLDLLEEQRVYGILIAPMLGGTKRIEEIRRRGTSVVLVDRRATSAQCSASVDDVAGGRLAATHLLDQGHRRIAFVGGPHTIQQVSDRLEGTRRAVADTADGASVTAVESEALNVASGRQAGDRLAALPVGDRPTGVFCANDLLALGVLQAMTRHGIEVPRELALVGYDDIEFAAAAAVPLTSVRQPRHQLGRAAADLLIAEVAQGAAHEHRQLVFSPELAVRESSQAAPLAPGVSTAGHVGAA